MASLFAALRGPEASVRSIIDDKVGQGALDAIESVKKLLSEKRKRFMKVWGDGEPAHPFLVNLGMIIKQCKQEDRHGRPASSGRDFVDAELFKEASRWAKYASAAYYATEAEIAEYIGCEESSILHVHASAGVQCPNFFVAETGGPVDADGAIVLCIRGTATAADALTDALADKVDFLGGQAHEGILANAREVVEKAQPVIEPLLLSTGKSLVVAGHSLGAGTAILASLLLASEGTLGSMASWGYLRCFAFAPPPCFAPADCLPRWAHRNVYSFVHNMDCVPRACLGTLTKLLLATKAVDDMPYTPAERLAYLSGDQEITDKLPDVVEVPEELGSDFGSLKGVGRLLLLLPSEERCEAVDSEQLDAFLLAPTMVADHSMSGYEAALDALALKHKDESTSPLGRLLPTCCVGR